MQLREIIWRDTFVDKLEAKHGVGTDEVEQVLFAKPHVRKAQKGRVKGEDLYAAYGRTDGGQIFDSVFHPKKGTCGSAHLGARHDQLRAEIL